MLTVICVLRSGGGYDADWVRKLRDGVKRNLTREHRFVCLSDVKVPCETIDLKHDFPGWWSKIELHRPGVIDGETLYLDLDTVITGPLDEVSKPPADFAMIRNFHDPRLVGSGVMWFKRPLEGVYERFLEGPERVMEWYDDKGRNGPYVGDQSFLWDTLDHEVKTVSCPEIRSYKKHCVKGLPEGTSLVCFHGKPKLTEVEADWISRCWV